MFTLPHILIILLWTVVVFVAGMFVEKNNAKKFDAVLNQLKALGDKVEAVAKKVGL